MVHEVPLYPITVGFASAKLIVSRCVLFKKVFWACNLNVFFSFNAVIYRWQQAVSNSVLRNILAFLNFAYTLLVLNYSCIGFQVSSKPLNQALVCFISCRKSEVWTQWCFSIWILNKRFFSKILTPCYGPYLWCTYDFALASFSHRCNNNQT